MKVVSRVPKGLPPGYTVEWLECDEHWHWLTETKESPEFISRAQARRSAWANYLSVPKQEGK